MTDGTEVDTEEYFQSLPNQTMLIFKQEHEVILTGRPMLGICLFIMYEFKYISRLLKNCKL